MLRKNKLKTALIFGVSGQDGSYLAKYLINNKNYKVVGISRKRKKIKNHKVLGINNHIVMEYSSYYDYNKIEKIVNKHKISEIYFFAGQPKPSISNNFFLETLYSNIIPVYIIIDIILKNNKKIRFFNSSSCEVFKDSTQPLNEKSSKEPINIYGLAKLISFEMVKFFREKYHLKLCSGIMFHHESILRGKEFVLRKIITSAKKIKLKKKKNLFLGNINISKDWGWAPEYVELIHKINNQKKIEDLIIATGKTYKLKFLINQIFKYYDLNWKKNVKIKKSLLRKYESKVNRADNRKLKKKFNWKPRNTAIEVVENLLANQLN